MCVYIYIGAATDSDSSAMKSESDTYRYACMLEREG